MLNVQFAFDLTGFAVSLAFAVVLLLGVWLALRKRWRFVSALVLPLLLSGGWLLQRGLVVESRVWPVVLAAIEETQGVERISRVRQLQKVWYFGEIKALDWWRLSRQWQVCHQIWPQLDCHMPGGPFEAEGLARESLQHLASGGA